MTERATGSIAACIVCLFLGCTDSHRGGSGGPPQGTGGTNAAGSPGASAVSGSSSSAGGSGKGSAGAAGTAAGTDCPANIAIPALCRVCAGNSCGTPTCSGGQFVGFVCPGDADAGMAGSGGSGGGGVCNLACVRGKHCEAKPKATCVDDVSDAGADAGATLHWFAGCGTPVCEANGHLFDDPNTPNCDATQREGAPCGTDGQRCDGVLSCGAALICAAQAPRTCPMSRARYKQDISYLSASERARFHDQITQLRLASYRYKTAPDVPQLGFMIDDVEPSVAVSGDHVNLYAYLSMAVAAIQVQDQQIKSLQQQLEQVRASLDASSQACMATPNPGTSGAPASDTLTSAGMSLGSTLR